MSLTLSLAGISVTLDKFINNEFPRVTLQPLGAVEFSAYGSVALQGSYHEPKWIWTVTALIDPQQRALLDAIAYEFQTRRRELVDCDILLYDTTSPIIERSPRTRALVPDTAETAIGGSHTQFFGQFFAGITDGPKYSQNGRKIVATLVLTETVKVTNGD